jgi:hypothetical protein
LAASSTEVLAGLVAWSTGHLSQPGHRLLRGCVNARGQRGQIAVLGQAVFDVIEQRARRQISHLDCRRLPIQIAALRPGSVRRQR